MRQRNGDEAEEHALHNTAGQESLADFLVPVNTMFINALKFETRQCTPWVIQLVAQRRHRNKECHVARRQVVGILHLRGMVIGDECLFAIRVLAVRCWHFRGRTRVGTLRLASDAGLLQSVVLPTRYWIHDNAAGQVQTWLTWKYDTSLSQTKQ